MIMMKLSLLIVLAVGIALLHGTGNSNWLGNVDYKSVVTSVEALYTKNSEVLELTPSNFNREVVNKKGVALVEFYAPWCGHCKNLVNDYEKTAKALKGIATVGAVDMTQHQSLGAPYDVKGFPTLIIFVDGKSEPYQGQRTAEDMTKTVMSAANRAVKDRLKGKSSNNGSKSKSNGGGGGGGGGSSSGSNSGSGSKNGNGDGKVIELSDRNFDEKVLNSQEMWMVAFIAPWCGHCQNLKPEWERAAKELGGISGIKIGQVDATVNQQLASRFQIQGFPTIKVFPPSSAKTQKTDGDAIDYPGGRTSSDIVQYAEEKFEQLGGAIEVEVRQIASQTDFDETCGKDGKCIMSFLPDLYTGGATARNEFLETLKEAASGSRHIPFVWVAANDQAQFENAYNLNAGYPAVLYLRELQGGEKVGFKYTGKFVSNELRAFAAAPLRLQSAIKAGWPKIETVTPWDGSEPPPLETEDDDFDLDAFLAEEA